MRAGASPQERHVAFAYWGSALLPGLPHPFDPNQPEDPPAFDLESEQAVLGSLMYENEAFLEVDGLLSPADFHEPFHQRLYKAIAQDIRNGRLADPTMLKTYFAIDPAFHDFGGVRYLGDLVDRAPPWSNVKFYAQKVRSMALRRSVIKIASDLLQRARLDFETDGAELMTGMEKAMLSASTGKDDLSFQTWGEVSRQVVYGMDRPEEKPLLKFGLDPLDAIIGGCEEGDMLVLGGRPGMGKSALAACMAMNVARAGYGVASVNAEMNTLQMGRRHLTDLAFWSHGLDAPMYRDIKRGTLTDAQRRIIAETQHEFDQLPMVMVKRTGLTLSRFRAMLMRQKMLWQSAGLKMRLVVLDHAGLIQPDEPTGNRTADQTIVSGALKQMAGDLEVVMVALAQLNRSVESREDKRPGLADLRDSGSWEQDADIVVGVYRDAYYARREQPPKKELELAEWTLRASNPHIEAIGLKVREGDVGTAKLWASIGHNAIRSHAPDSDLFQ